MNDTPTARAPVTDAVREYVDQYSFRCDGGGGYDPTENERAMLEDAIIGFLHSDAAHPPAAEREPNANIRDDGPSEREKAFREALALADAEVVFAQHGIVTSEAGTTERAMNVMARNTARDIAKAIKALLAIPAAGGGT